ncbi:MAG: hypothetical protein CXX81_00645 [Methanobacteriota archaeon]|nr:MAG: hypothetical protein CXX81_22600 [Euryarchaeota archaeon]PXY75221.1 MAG: hypothetical protein CXX81_19125 [Euryarchaeota archaeon]PXY77683.1 MAG: hypothetical protein CXX81_11680 [Euryarchaeota archaeon]PXY79929.1 MAG: hypothetical protein CXX81_00645 [Euryarchaeota archaeon]
MFVTKYQQGDGMAFRKRKKNDTTQPIGSLPLPPPPGDLPPPPSPEMELPLPPAPTPPTEPLSVSDTEPSDDIIEIDVVEVIAEDEEDPNYADLWQNRTDKSLQQMYGHIDRLGSSDVGSLLERYADRFGHDLDREIIVMRKSEKETTRESAPVVELLSVPEESSDSEDSEMAELEERLSELESEMRPLKQKFDAAKSKKKQSAIAKFGNLLKPMVDERKLLKGIIAGDIDYSELEEYDTQEEIVEEEVDADQNFSDFFDVVNNLLGDMPEDFISDFIASKSFKLFEKVGEDAASTTNAARKKFFNMVNQELGTIPDDKLQEFMATPGFQLFIEMSEIYGE